MKGILSSLNAVLRSLQRRSGSGKEDLEIVFLKEPVAKVIKEKPAEVSVPVFREEAKPNLSVTERIEPSKPKRGVRIQLDPWTRGDDTENTLHVPLSPGGGDRGTWRDGLSGDKKRRGFLN